MLLTTRFFNAAKFTALMTLHNHFT